jgi:hypothetical protein
MRTLQALNTENTERQLPEQLGLAPWPLWINLCALCVKSFAFYRRPRIAPRSLALRIYCRGMVASS